jgi:predicted lipoprotein
MKRPSIPFFLFLAILASASPTRAAPDHAELAAAIADRSVIPAYRAYADRTARLSAALTASCGAAGQWADADIRTAFGDAMEAWQHVRPVTFGPVSENSLHVRIQFWPDRRGTAARQLRRAVRAKDPDMTTPAGIGGRSGALQGLPAIEALIYGFPAETYACRLASAIAGYQRDIAASLVAAWTGPNGFRSLLVPPAGGNAHYLAAKDAASDFFKALATALESIIEQKLEKPLGKTIVGASPRLAESWRSGRSLANVAANLDTLGDWFEMPGGFSDQLAKAGAGALGIGMTKAFRKAAAEARAVPGPLAAAVADPARRPKVDALLESIRDLRTLVRDVAAGELDLVIGFNSLDGD